VTFEDVGGGQTSVHLVLEYEPEGLVEKIGDKLNVVENQAEGDLDRFKAFIESEGYATGAWRGSVDTGTSAGEPGIETAAGSRGDSGKAGVSGKVAAGVGLAAAAAAVGAAAAAKSRSDDAAEADTDVAATPAATVPPELRHSQTDARLGDSAPAGGDSTEEDILVDPKRDPGETTDYR
jgi:hypothetical protein